MRYDAPGLDPRRIAAMSSLASVIETRHQSMSALVRFGYSHIVGPPLPQST